MPEAVAAPAAPAAQTNAVADQKNVATETTEQKPPAPDVKALWKQAVSGKTIKHRGVEKKLEDFDPDEAADYIRRGFGATELAAESKKAMAEADKVRAYQKRIAEGDDDDALNALVEFGGERSIKLLEGFRQRLAKEQEEVGQMTERERAMHAELQRRDDELRQHQAKEKQRLAAEEEAEGKRVFAETRTAALKNIGELVKTLDGFPQTKSDALVPFMARAMREAMDLRQELGRDVKPEAIQARAAELFKASTSDFYAGLSTEEQFNFIGQANVAKLSALLVKKLRGAPLQQPIIKAPAPGNGQAKPGAAPKLGDPGYFK